MNALVVFGENPSKTQPSSRHTLVSCKTKKRAEGASYAVMRWGGKHTVHGKAESTYKKLSNKGQTQQCRNGRNTAYTKITPALSVVDVLGRTVLWTYYMLICHNQNKADGTPATERVETLVVPGTWYRHSVSRDNFDSVWSRPPTCVTQLSWFEWVKENWRRRTYKRGRV